MTLLGSSFPLLGPIWPQNGPQNGSQKLSKRCPKRDPKHDSKDYQKSANFGPQNGPQNGPKICPKWANLASWVFLSSLGALLGSLGALLGSLGALLGFPWALLASLGTLLGSLGALLASLVALSRLLHIPSQGLSRGSCLASCVCVCFHLIQVNLRQAQERRIWSKTIQGSPKINPRQTQDNPRKPNAA